MASIDEVLNFAVPAILLLIAFGFIYTKFLKPWVIPWLKEMWDKLNEPNQNVSRDSHSRFSKKEIAYD